MKLYGKNPVLERLKTTPKSIKKIYVQQDHSEASYLRKKAKQHGISFVSIPKSKVLKLSRNIKTQGILAEVDDFAYMPFEDLLNSAKKKKSTIVFLDGLNDPQNLGAIMRSLACLGHFYIVLPRHDSVDVTEAVMRVASGADNYIQVAKVPNLSHAIKQTKESGFLIAGGVIEGGEDITEIELPFPLCLVIGSEQKGIRDVIVQKLDLKITIPMRYGHISLNVAQATTIFCYEITKQKKQKYKK